MNTLPTTREQREFTLAEMRVERLRLQLVVAELDFIGVGVEAGFIPPEAVPRLKAELYGTAEGTDT